MSNMVIAKVKIKGMRPLFWHKFGADALPLDKRQERTGVAGNDPEEWKRTVLMTEDRQLYLDPTNVFGSIRDGAKYTSAGRGSIQPKVAATLQIMGDRILLDRFVPDEPIPTDINLPVYMDIRGVRNPATKSRNVRYRIAAATGWEVSFRLLWDRTVVTREQMKACITDAGILVGIGDGRSMGYGRYELVAFETGD